jgi:SAM-dependent MidA family methyltransferase
MNALGEQIREHIRQHGPMPFAEYMSRALYDPIHGYYRHAGDQIGKRGDFFTSVSVGSFFGELLAFQFARWFEAMQEPASVFQIVEAGAHDGQLAHDVLKTFEQHEAALFRTVEYWIVEPSANWRAAQQATLADFKNVRWFEKISEIQNRVRGVIFSNELLDAMPVHPFAWNVSRRCWEELGVTIRDDSLAWTRLPSSTIRPPELPELLLEVLPDGYIVELSPAAIQWWQSAASALVSGKLVAIDYGGTFEEMLSPGRISGTLRAFTKHHTSADVLVNPGEQDITAHVNFFEVQRAGEASGLKTNGFTTQSQFLTEIARELWTRRGSWPENQVRQFQTLTHLEHLGRLFRILIQAR